MSVCTYWCRSSRKRLVARDLLTLLDGSHNDILLGSGMKVSTGRYSAKSRWTNLEWRLVASKVVSSLRSYQYHINDCELVSLRQRNDQDALWTSPIAILRDWAIAIEKPKLTLPPMRVMRCAVSCGAYLPDVNWLPPVIVIEGHTNYIPMRKTRRSHSYL